MKRNNKIIMLYAVIFIVSVSGYAQRGMLKKIKLADVRNNSYELDSLANAVIIYKLRKTSFEEITPKKWQVVTEVHERVKILKKAGINYGSKIITLNKSKTEKDSIIKFKGVIYKDDGKRLRKEKINKKNLIVKSSGFKREELIFKSSNIGVGDIVEWTYKIVSPFWKIDELIIQSEIPTIYYSAKVRIPSYFYFNRIVNGYIKVKSKESSNHMDIAVKQYSKKYTKFMTGILKESIKDSVFQVSGTETHYELKDIPALKHQPFTDNINNYRSFVGYELESSDLPGEGYKNYNITWDKHLKNIYSSNNFGIFLKNTDFLKTDAEFIKSTNTKPEEIVKSALKYIKRKMLWNGDYGVFAKRNLEASYKSNSGNVAEINLMLVCLLRMCGLTASPVLIRTRDMGLSFYMNQDSFNYVIAAVDIDGRRVLLDATETFSTLNVLPLRVLNREGILLRNEDDFKSINVYPTKTSQINKIIHATLNNEGSITGEISTVFTQMDALKIRNSIKSKAHNVATVQKTFGFKKVSNYNLKNFDELEKPVVETYTFHFENQIKNESNQIMFSPLIFFESKENPFKLDERNHPINYNYPRIRRTIINVNITENHQVKFLPSPLRIKLPNNLGSFAYNITSTEEGFSVLSVFELNQAIISPQKYLELKAFYNLVIDKVLENVILKTKT